MKKLLSAVVLCSSVSAFAGISATATLTSDYVWRGQTQSGHDAAVQGSIDYEHESGFNLGVWASSLGGDTGKASAAGQEVDLYAGYTYKINDMHSVGLSITNYTYTRDANLGWAEYALTYSSPWFDLFVGSTSEYGGNEDDGASTYVNISKGWTLDEKQGFGINLAYGMTQFGDEDKFGQTGYSDYKIGLTKQKGDWTAELFHTNTTGRESINTTTLVKTKQEQDSVVGFSLSTSL